MRQYLNREVVIIMVDVPPTTAIHAADRLVEAHRPNEMRIVEEAAAKDEAVVDIRAGGEVHYLRLYD